MGRREETVKNNRVNKRGMGRRVKGEYEERDGKKRRDS